LPAASIITAMMLLPSTQSPSLATRMRLSKRLAQATNLAAARACRPSLIDEA
jgi:hypothetical protein